MKMYRVPPDRAWWLAVGVPLERRVRRLCLWRTRMDDERVLTGYAATAVGGRLFRMGRGTVADPQCVLLVWPAPLCLPRSPEAPHVQPSAVQARLPEYEQRQRFGSEAVTEASEPDLSPRVSEED